MLLIGLAGLGFARYRQTAISVFAPLRRDRDARGAREPQLPSFFIAVRILSASVALGA